MTAPAPVSTCSPTGADQLLQALEVRAPATVLDIRPAADRAEWWIPGSVHLDAYDALKRGDASALMNADLPNDRLVVVVCRAGMVAQEGARWLRERGLDASYLAGGMRAWGQVSNHAAVPLAGSAARVIQVRRTGKDLPGSGDTRGRSQSMRGFLMPAETHPTGSSPVMQPGL